MRHVLYALWFAFCESTGGLLALDAYLSSRGQRPLYYEMYDFLDVGCGYAIGIPITAAGILIPISLEVLRRRSERQKTA